MTLRARYCLFAVFLSIVIAVTVAGRTTERAAPALVVTHATLWTPRGTLPEHEILINDGHVAAVGRVGSLVRPAHAHVLDAHGDTLLPGLIDAHVHLTSGVRLPDDFEPAARARALAKQLLRSGVTSMRLHLWDLPSATSFKSDAGAVTFPGPRVQIGGPGLFGGQPDWYAEGGNVWGVKSADDAVMKLRRLRAAGVDWVALHDLRRFLPGELDAIVAEARRLDLRVMAGGDRLADVERAVELGVDSIEYLDRSDTPRYPDELIARMQARGASLFLVPSIGFPHRFVAYRQDRMGVDNARLTEFFPTAAASFAIKALADDRTQAIPNAPTWKEVPATLPEKFRELRAAGLQVITGTDCGSPAHIQADSIWWELETWRQLGVPVGEIVHAATVLPAALLREPAAGQLDVGAHGDFVLYRGDVNAGALTVERVRAVAKGGVLFVDEGRWVGP